MKSEKKCPLCNEGEVNVQMIRVGRSLLTSDIEAHCIKCDKSFDINTVKFVLEGKIEIL